MSFSLKKIRIQCSILHIGNYGDFEVDSVIIISDAIIGNVIAWQLAYMISFNPENKFCVDVIIRLFCL